MKLIEKGSENMADKKTITWQFTLGNGKEVKVVYTPRAYYNYDEKIKYRFDHFEFHGEAISETGYYSNYATVDPDPAFDGVDEAYNFAKKRIVELSGVGFEEWEGQLELF
jgi:hypothetical protein